MRGRTVALWLLATLVVATAFLGGPAHAIGLRVAPVEYRATLSGNEKKKGVIDITNPDETETIVVGVVAQGFRQINSAGDVEYFDDSRISAGLIPDLTSFSLKPHETMRMYFLLDGTKLPSGDVFAALVFRTKPVENLVQTGVVNELKVGVLFSVVNGSAGDRQAEISSLNVPFWQLSGEVKGSYSVKNTSDTKGAGFFPEVMVALNPFTRSSTVTSPLVFPGIERSKEFSLSTDRFGFYKLSVTFEGSTKEQWVFVASPWQLRLIALSVVLVAGWLLVRSLYRRYKK